MKPRNNRRILAAAIFIMLAPVAFAADGTWNTSVTPSSWDTPGNWLADTANGSGFTANFNALDITADTTVTLDTDRMIGNLVFGDTATGSAAGWLLAGAGAPAGKLTLAGTSPTITVNALGGSKNTSITATLEGTSGFTKAGAGTLVLNNITNTISGAVVLSTGTLSIQSRPLTGATSVAINGGTLVSATAGFKPMGDATISFGGGTLQYNNDPGYDYSAQFAASASQQYRINVQPSRIVTYATNLASEGGTLTKLAAGTLILSAANTFTGATTVSAGNLELSNALALQNSAINTSASIVGTTSAGLVLTGVTSPTFGGLTGNKALASLFDTDSGNYGLVTNVTLKPVTGTDYTFTGVIADGAAGMTLTKSGPGRQVLGVANSYTGGTIMNAGTLNYGNASALSSGPITFTGGSILQAGVATTLANPISVASSITGTVGTAGFATTLSGPITGDGTLAKGGTGVLTLTGGLDNTIAGAFRVASGRLTVTDGLSLTNTGPVIVLSSGSLNYSKNFAAGNNLTNDITLNGAGDGSFGALNIWGNATATGTISLDSDATISHDFNNATISGPINGTDHSLTLTTLTAGQPGMTVSGPITLGTGGVTVQGVANSGNFSIKLSGTNSYTGDTHVVSGTLMLSGDARINNSSTVRIDTGAVLHLDFAGTDTVGALFLPGDPNPKPEGTYGSPTSLATNKSADFAGDGILQVTIPSNNYASWAITNGIGGEPFDEDFNEDGITNGVAYALGLSPTASSQPAGVLSGNTITFTKGDDAIANADVSWIIETSETLMAGSWTDQVTHDPGDITEAISYDLNPVPGTPKKFARLKAVKVP